jgi:hypothetical protein
MSMKSSGVSSNGEELSSAGKSGVLVEAMLVKEWRVGGIDIVIENCIYIITLYVSYCGRPVKAAAVKIPRYIRTRKWFLCVV